ncbi:MAG TPA: N-acetyltransferase [Anaerolineales bacterium]|nr:N-acetyltransferase [Anaerolineae bacterium]HIQ02037.1 N-acetyltransferase [Anaerolineales bacterium]
MIEGEKVRLRPVEREDLPRYVRWFSDPEVRRHLSVYLPFSLAQEERWYEGLQERLRRNEAVVLAIETSEGIHIGNIGLHGINWKDRSAELGIVIGEKEYWGQGYGTDAIRTLLRVAFEGMNLHRIYLRVDADNVRGIRCYEKCGFHREGTLRDAVFREGRYYDQLLMSILRPESQALRGGDGGDD